VSEFYPGHHALARFKWALIDASARQDLPPHWPTTVVAPAFLGDDTDRCPALIDLLALPVAERVEWCDALHHDTLALRDTPASLLIAADSSAQRLATHFAQRMVIRPPGQDRPMQWRFFDPGTCLQMPRVLGTAGMAWLMGPASAFMVPWAGEWTLIGRPEPSSELPDTDTRQYRLKPEQLAALSRLGIINRALMQGQPTRNATEWMAQSERLDAIVLRAQSHSLSHRDDLATYAHHAHTVHPRIHEHPRMQALLAQLRNAHPDDELDYRGLTAAIEPEAWRVMAAELQSSSHQEEIHP